MSSPPLSGARASRALAAGLIVGAALLHLLYLASHAALDLAPDEAHYWDWSRHLDWSYYSKGPLVAYLIRLGAELAGPLSVALTGTEALAVRLPAVVCGSLLLAGLYILTVQVYRDERLALIVVAIALTLPPVAAGSSLMTIDAPYTCCWTWALVLGYHAVFGGVRGDGETERRRDRGREQGPALRLSVSPSLRLLTPGWWAWPAAGLAVGLGILAKYTMVLWLPSLALFLLTDPQRRRLLARPGFWVMAGVASLAGVPILVWNARHDWVTVRHVFGQAGGHRAVSWLGPLDFTATQFLLLLGFWFVAWASAMIAHRPWREPDAGRRYLWWLSAPMFAFFFVFGLKTGGGEPNWPVTAYLSGLVLAADWLTRQLRQARGRARRWQVAGLATTCALGLGLILFMHFSTWLHPLLARLPVRPTERQPYPLRRFDPTCRLRGWRSLAAEVDRLRAELRREGVEPVLAASGWALPGELAFYCDGHPTVYSLGLALGDRCSQYDFWRPNPLADREQFLGRTVIFVGPSWALEPAFERIEPTRIITHHEDGRPLAAWAVTVCRGYRGLSPAQTPPRF